jgi:hypothetical protein
MNEADFKTAVAIIKTGTEPGVPVGEIEGRVCAALPGITDKDLEAAFERAADEFSERRGTRHSRRRTGSGSLRNGAVILSTQRRKA